MDKCDVLVAGAGLSGSTASLILSKKGYKVYTIDKTEKIGGFTNNKIDITESELPDGSKLGDILKEINAKPLKEFNKSKWHSRNEDFILEPDVYDYYFKRGPSKDSIDYQIMNQAINAGCIFENNTVVDKFNIKNDQIYEVIIKKGNKKISINPKIIIGADGSYSNCRKLGGITEKKSGVLEGIGMVIKNEENQYTKVFFDTEYAPGGYIYFGAEKKDCFVAMMIDRKKTNFSLKQLLEYNKKKNKFFKYIEDNEIKNTFTGSEKYGILEGIRKNNLLLVGGAGLLINPFMGYGVNYAIVSGYKAAKIIDDNLTNNVDLENYNNYYYENFLPYFKNAIKARLIFNKLTNKDLDFIIRSFNYITKENAEGLKVLIQIFKAKPTSIKALRILNVFSKILL